MADVIDLENSILQMQEAEYMYHCMGYIYGEVKKLSPQWRTRYSINCIDQNQRKPQRPIYENQNCAYEKTIEQIKKYKFVDMIK